MSMSSSRFTKDNEDYKKVKGTSIGLPTAYRTVKEENRSVCPVCGSHEVICSKKSNFCHRGCNKHDITG